ncbi:MAG TPA: hypothetical protein VF978_05825 [Gemmatimonadales bacterium]
MKPRPASLVALALVVPAAFAGAQDSQFGIRGLGTPERQESIRSRTTGGAFALFDALSPLSDATLVDLVRLTAAVGGGTSNRRVTLGGEEASLRTTRLSNIMVGGLIVERVALGGGFAAYLNRSHRVTTRDTVMLRGELEPYTDDVTSEGGVTDVRIGTAWRPARQVSLGASFHVLTGSTRVTALRTWDDSLSYGPAAEVDQTRFDGLGLSAGVLLTPISSLRLGAYVRSDDRLQYTTRDTTAAYDLPVTWGAGIRWQPGRLAAVAASVQASSWGTAQGVNAHNTVSWSAGLEVGKPTRPFRFGVRGGQLPFGPGPEAPTELGLVGGIGFLFSGGRGVIDIGVERLDRKGGGLTERVWTALLGVSVRP